MKGFEIGVRSYAHAVIWRQTVVHRFTEQRKSLIILAFF